MRRFWVFWLVLGITAVFTPRVLAHAELVSASPAPGSSVSVLTEIRLVFSEPVGANGRIDLMQDFVPAAKLSPMIDPTDPHVLLTAVPPLADGVYTVQWTVNSVDGHPISGSYSLGINSTPPQTAVPWYLTFWARLFYLLCAIVIILFALRRWRPASAPRRMSGG